MARRGWLTNPGIWYGVLSALAYAAGNVARKNVRKYGDKLLIKPARKSVASLLNKVREVLGKNKAATQAQVIMSLNPILRGWAMYHRHVVAAATFSRVDHLVWTKLWVWAKRRHPCKPIRWIKARYFERHGLRDWVFDSVVMNPVRSRAAGRLEPCAGKLACTVLRGEHAGNGVFLPDGKARKPYEFGVKVSLAVTHKQGLMVGARSLPGNPYDGHVLAEQLEQTTILLQDLGRSPRQVVVDLGFRGVDAANPGVEIIHRGKYKTLTREQKRWLKRRQAIEPMIGHAKSDNRMDRCWLQGSLGDALHALSCAAGYNIRWLLRAIARLGPGLVFLRLKMLAAMAALGSPGLTRLRYGGRRALARFVNVQPRRSPLGVSVAFAGN